MGDELKFNTLTMHPMTAMYREWSAVDRSGVYYREYADARPITCTVTVSPVGSVSLMANEKLQLFGIIYDMKDAAGIPVMDEWWYSVQKVMPVLDSAGYVSSYRHTIAYLAPELVEQPIDPPTVYPGIDQQA